jgi:hypothetical protein
MSSAQTKCGNCKRGSCTHIWIESCKISLNILHSQCRWRFTETRWRRYWNCISLWNQISLQLLNCANILVSNKRICWIGINYRYVPLQFPNVFKLCKILNYEDLPVSVNLQMYYNKISTCGELAWRGDIYFILPRIIRHLYHFCLCSSNDMHLFLSLYPKAIRLFDCSGGVPFENVGE